MSEINFQMLLLNVYVNILQLLLTEQQRISHKVERSIAYNI